MALMSWLWGGVAGAADAASDFWWYRPASGAVRDRRHAAYDEEKHDAAVLATVTAVLALAQRRQI